MKQNKILTALGFVHVEQHSTNRQLTKRIVQVTALSLSCIVSLPSFAQGPICLGGYWNGSACIFNDYSDNNGPWDNSGSTANNPHPYSYGCQQIGCDSSNDDYGDYESCDSYDRSSLRTRRSELTNCFGDPGPVFDIDLWIDNVGLTMFEWLNAPVASLYEGIWEDARPAMLILFQTLERNNFDMIAAYQPFATLLYDGCQANYPGGDLESGGLFNCLRSSYYLLDNYAPDQSMFYQFVNWAVGISLDTTNYDSSWGGRFTRDATNYILCRDVYDEWQEKDCSGSI